MLQKQKTLGGLTRALQSVTGALPPRLRLGFGAGMALRERCNKIQR